MRPPRWTPSRDVGERAIGSGALQGRPDGDREPPAGRQHAPHLAQCSQPVGQIHQGELADHGVEAARLEGQVAGVALAPVDLRPDAARDGEHAVVEVEARDAAFGAGPLGGLARQDAGAAGDVEHPVAGPDRGRLGDRRRPLAEQRGHEFLLVDDRGVVRDLPSFLFRHDGSSWFEFGMRHA